MKLNDNYSKVFEQLQVLKKPAAPVNTESAPSPAAKTPEAKTPGDSVKQLEGKQGKATASMGMFAPGAAIQEWKHAAKAGKKLDLASNPGDGLGSLKALLNHAKASKYSPEQQKNLQTFMRGLQTPLSNLGPSALEAKKQLDLLEDTIDTHGITHEQLDLIMNGDFKAEDFLTMVRESSAIPCFGPWPAPAEKP